MREVLFRGFHSDKNGKTEITLNGKKIKGGWVYGYYVEATRHWHKYGTHKSWIVTSALQNGGYFNVMGRYSVIPETVGQFTGLTDRNGKNIYEGDIVKIDGKYTRYVVYSGEHTAFCVMRYIDKQQSELTGTLGDGYDNYKRQYEVVGNIYDNPELLGGGK